MAVDAVLAGEDLAMAEQKNIPSILIPRQTLDCVVKMEAARRDGVLVKINESVDNGLFDCQAKQNTSISTHSLTNPEFRSEL